MKTRTVKKISAEEKKLSSLLKEALNIIDKGCLFGLDLESTAEYYKKAYTYMINKGYLK